MDNETIVEELKKTLKTKRFVHSLGVAYTSANLAMRYNYDMDKAFRAGLLHDCGKYMSDSESYEYCKKHKISVSDAEVATKALLHAKIGEYLAEKKFEETDSEILDAIRWHTTGKPAMTLYEKIVFVADYIEPNRSHDTELPILRKLAYENIDVCILKIYENTINYINGSNKKMDPTTIDAYEYYSKLIKGDI